MEEKKESSSLMHDFNSSTPKSKLSSKGEKSSTMKYIGIFIVVILLGVGSGYVISTMKGATAKKVAGVPNYSVTTGKSFGVTDTKDFPDTAEGSLKEGGIEGEGAYHLVRPGGDDQNVYLTSSSVDLSQFVGKSIKVWGTTQTAQHAGWLMDVGKVQVL